MNGAWLQAYEIGIDPRTRVEKKRNLLNFDQSEEREGSSDRAKQDTGAFKSARGQMVHKAIAGKSSAK